MSTKIELEKDIYHYEIYEFCSTDNFSQPNKTKPERKIFLCTLVVPLYVYLPI